MTPPIRTALVRGQVALGVPRPEAEDFARFVADTLCTAQRLLVNEKATAVTVASYALFERSSVYQDISTEVLETQEFPLDFPENSPLAAPNRTTNTPVTPTIPIFQRNQVEPVPA